MNVKFVNEAKSKQRKKNRTAVHKQTSLIAGSKKGGHLKTAQLTMLLQLFVSLVAFSRHVLVCVCHDKTYGADAFGLILPSKCVS